MCTQRSSSFRHWANAQCSNKVCEFGRMGRSTLGPGNCFRVVQWYWCGDAKKVESYVYIITSSLITMSCDVNVCTHPTYYTPWPPAKDLDNWHQWHQWHQRNQRYNILTYLPTHIRLYVKSFHLLDTK